MITIEKAFALRKGLLNDKTMTRGERLVLLNVLAGCYDKHDIEVAKDDILFLNKEEQKPLHCKGS